jgi:hypothetical protein
VYYHFFHRALCYSRMVPVWHIVQFQKGCGLLVSSQLEITYLQPTQPISTSIITTKRQAPKQET